MARQRGRASRSVLVVIAVAIVVAATYAVQGGEWGTFDLLRQRQRLASLRRDVDSLQRFVDSLQRYKTALETDPVLQEKVAREDFGMVRGNKELLYRFTEPSPADSTKAASRKP